MVLITGVTYSVLNVQIVSVFRIPRQVTADALPVKQYFAIRTMLCPPF